jgi:hypothetical protein
MAVPTSYSKFKFDDLTALGIQVKIGDIFTQKPAQIAASEWLLTSVEDNIGFPIGTEKSRSELFVTPILLETRRRSKSFSIFSGYQFDVDKNLGLKGHCDFLLSQMPDSQFIEAPVIAVVGAKNDNVIEGIPQCVAEMLAARMFNEKRNNKTLVIHGIVTSGTEWLFLRLDTNNIATRHKDLFYLNDLNELLGALQTIIDFYKN